MAHPMANVPPFATLNHFEVDSRIPGESDAPRIGISVSNPTNYEADYSENVDMHALSTAQWIVKHPLSEHRKVRNIARYLAWQLRSRLLRKPYVFEFVNGSKMLAKPGMTGATGNLYVGLHEFHEMSFALHYMRRGDLFVDVGANVGSYTILASVAVGADVLAFEPGDEAFAWLVRNIELNGASERVEARCEAVGAAAGSTSFTSGLDTVNRIDPHGSVTVAVTTIDAACENRCPAMIKIDVEGWEEDVLRGGDSVLRRPGPQAVLMELNDPAASELLGSLGFACYAYDPFTRRATPRVDAKSGNGIFIKGIEHARCRLEHAPAFSVRDWLI